MCRAAQQAQTVHGQGRLQALCQGPESPPPAQLLQSGCLPGSAWKVLCLNVSYFPVLLCFCSQALLVMRFCMTFCTQRHTQQGPSMNIQAGM